MITFKNFGSKKQSRKAINTTMFSGIREDLGIDHKDKGLLVCALELEDRFKEKLKGQNIMVDHYPLLGLDCYKDLDFIILASRHLYDITTQYIMSYKFGVQLVKDIMDSYTIQAVGRLRIGDKPWLSNDKLLITYFDFDHYLFPNTTDVREYVTKKWLRKQLKDGDVSARKLCALSMTSGLRYMQKNRADFFKYVREFKEENSKRYQPL